MRRWLCPLLLVAVLVPWSAAHAQAWRSLGVTKRDSTRLFVNTKSIGRGGDTVHALVLSRFAHATWDPSRKDSLRAITTDVTFDCRLDKVLVRETIYYVDFDRKKIAERRKPGRPGWGAVFSAAFVQARDSLCARPAR